MPIDVDLLAAHAHRRDPELGISERFVRLPLSGGSTVGVLAAPLGEPRAPAWLLCHAFGAEQLHLAMTEAATARGLAAAGFPTLRFHCQGYGDSEDVSSPPRLSTHVRDTVDALEHLRSLTGGTSLAVLGMRLGGTVAAIVAERLSLPNLAMIAPVVSGRRFVSELLRSQQITDMAAAEGRPDGAGELRTALSRTASVEVEGVTVTPEAVSELEAVDLLADVSGFRGRALVVQVSFAERPQRRLRDLADHLTAAGADATFRIVTDPEAPRFGHEHYHTGADHLMRSKLAGLTGSVADAVVAWAAEGASTALPGAGR